VFGTGLPDGLFSNQNPNLGKFCRALDWKMLLYFMAIRNILRIFRIYILGPFGTFCVRLVHFFGFGILYHEKSGTHGLIL
jgi:hypothetical protein